MLSLFSKVATTNNYEVYFTGFGSLQKLNGYITKKNPRVNNYFITRELGLLCNRAGSPGTSFATAQIEGDRMGITEKFAHSRIYTDTSLTFYVDSDYRVVEFFETWQEFIANGSGVTDGVDPRERAYYHRMHYPSEYKVQTMKILKFNKDHFRSVQYTFLNAFPVNVTSMPVSYGNARLMECTVTFAYDRYFFGDITSLTPTSRVSPATGPAAPGNEETRDNYTGAGGFTTPDLKGPSFSEASFNMDLDINYNLDVGPLFNPFTDATSEPSAEE